MVSTGVVSITLIILTLLKFVKERLELELGQQILGNIIMLLMENMEACGALEEEFQVSFVDSLLRLMVLMFHPTMLETRIVKDQRQLG